MTICYYINNILIKICTNLISDDFDDEAIKHIRALVDYNRVYVSLVNSNILRLDCKPTSILFFDTTLNEIVFDYDFETQVLYYDSIMIENRPFFTKVIWPPSPHFSKIITSILNNRLKLNLCEHDLIMNRFDAKGYYNSLKHLR